MLTTALATLVRLPRPTALTLFSGGGLVARGLEAAGWEIAGGVEWDPDIAACYDANFTIPCTVADLTQVAARFFLRWAGIDLLQASPECKRASTANPNATESHADWLQAGAICRALIVLRPRVVVIENVAGYRHFRSYARILAWLRRLGYAVDSHVYNTADYGVPQTRKRLIIRAMLDVERVPVLHPTHGDPRRYAGQMFAPLPWVGWYSAVADLVPTLLPSQFAAWQLARLPAHLDAATLVTSGMVYRRGPLHHAATAPAPTVVADQPRLPLKAVLFDNQESDRATGGVPFRDAAQPALTVRAGYSNRPRAFLVDGQASDHARRLTVPDGETPGFTVQASSGKKRPLRALLVDGTHRTGGDLTVRDATDPSFTLNASAARRGSGVPHAWLTEGHVVVFTVRAGARLQTVPDSYRLPGEDFPYTPTGCSVRALAWRIVGNGVPCLFMQRIAESLRGGGRPSPTQHDGPGRRGGTLALRNEGTPCR